MKVKKNILKRTQALSLGPSQQKKHTDSKKSRKCLISTSPKPGPENYGGLKQSNAYLPQGIILKIRPKESAMEMLVQVLKKSHITYKFFPIVRLLLEKGDRYQIIIDSELTPFFYLESEQQPFLTLERAQAYLVAQLWPSYFEEEKKYIDPPKGVFTSVNRCGLTNILIGPPNYHLYNELLKSHYQEHLKERYSWKNFIGQIKNEHSLNCVQQWLNQVSCFYRYRFKPNPEICFDHKSSAKNYLIQQLNLNEKLKPITHLALSVDQVHGFHDEQLKAAIENEIRREIKTPVKLGSYCRAFLHHSGFHIYRKGKKTEMVTYICSIKRNIRDEFIFFTEKINGIITCIEQHPYKTLEQLVPYFFTHSGDETSASDQKILEFKRDLILLIKQGYVTQYEDGTLYISPPQTLASKQNRKKEEV